MSVINVINRTGKTVVWNQNSIYAAIRHLPDNVISKETETKGSITVDMPCNDQQIKEVMLDVKIKTLPDIGLDLTNDRLTKYEHAQLHNLLYEYKECFASDVSEVGIINGTCVKVDADDLKPIYLRSYRFNVNQEADLEGHIKTMLQNKTI